MWYRSIMRMMKYVYNASSWVYRLIFISKAYPTDAETLGGVFDGSIESLTPLRTALGDNHNGYPILVWNREGKASVMYYLDDSVVGHEPNNEGVFEVVAGDLLKVHRPSQSIEVRRKVFVDGAFKSERVFFRSYQGRTSTYSEPACCCRNR